MQHNVEDLVMEVEELYTTAKPASMPSKDSFVPIIDIQALCDPGSSPEAKHRVIDEIGIALREVGFIIIIGHGIHPFIID